MKRVLQCDVFLHSVWQAWVCKYHHLGNRVMFMTFWLKVEPNWLKHSVLPPPLPLRSGLRWRSPDLLGAFPGLLREFASASRERNGEGSRLSDGLDPSVDPAGGSRVETSQSNILLEVGWKEVL